jgi:hypothetical protein
MGKNYFFEIREVPLARVIDTASRKAKKENKRRVKVFLPYPYAPEIYPGKTWELETEKHGKVKVRLRASLRGWVIDVEFINIKKVNGTQLRLPFYRPEEQE